MIDLNPSRMKRADAIKAIHKAIDDALIKEAQTQTRRDYLGASAIGAGCERRTQYEYMKAAYDADYVPNPKTQRIFARGHIGEDMAAGWLRMAGYDLVTEDKNGRQFRFETAGGRFAGHIDGIIRSGPNIDTPCIWECKCVGAKSWAAIDRNGVAKAKPEYADQVAIYQAYLDMTAPALFMAVNMDTMELYLELVPFDRKRAQAASDKAVAIIMDTDAGALRPRASDDPDFWLCSNRTGKCPFWSKCHDA